MTKALKINKNIEKGIIDVLKFLLESGKIKGVFTLKKTGKEGAVTYSLITKSDELKDAVPLYPLMPTNAGKLLSRFTLRGSTDSPVIAVVRPCELRAFIELVKREQGRLDNIFFISSTCGGVYPLKMAADKKIEGNLSKYWDAVRKGEILTDLRSACKGCEEFVPYNADMTVDLIAKNDIDKQCLILLNNEKAEKLTEGFKGEFLTRELDNGKMDKFRGKREIEKKKLFNEIEAKMKGLDGFIDIFGKCLGCHGCSKVCPICYCKLCEFESPDSEYKPSNYESDLEKRGGLRVPPGITYFQIGRLDHVTISCVGCGSCEDVCPVDIPLTSIYKKVGESVQKLFNYIPGKDVKEEIPLLTFEKEEFSEFED